MPSTSAPRNNRAKYQALDDEEEKQQFLYPDNGNFEHGLARPAGLSRTYRLLTALNIVILGLSIALAAHSFHFRATLVGNKGNALLKISDWYSPVHNLAQIDIIHARVNGTLLDTDHSIFRQPPSPQVDAAWDRIGSLLPHVISRADVVRLGKDPSKAARFPEDWDFGPEAYMAELDVMHTIHCLNAIRRDVHWRHYFGDRYPDGVFPELHRVHTDHCLYIVLQDLMCHATADMITTPWVDGQLNPFPDFNINRKCRDFEGIVRWHEQTAVTDMERYKALRKPEDVIPYRMSDEFHEKFGTDDGLFAPFHSHGGGHGHEGHMEAGIGTDGHKGHQ
ncbi:hypothetical protein C8A05DRAFT_17618 [Staphylotrichum tortipilum]|uniref:Tat pathway signal sequence n=1 Tax=Staphylotrichum tortipilum TaxID=2831512 RepID=A0AAN6MH39_9PEZI|nr:hypothetical protein C8A05DRAFT_17618 [Staphylotrichum longicolle]